MQTILIYTETENETKDLQNCNESHKNHLVETTTFAQNKLLCAMNYVTQKHLTFFCSIIHNSFQYVNFFSQFFF